MLIQIAFLLAGAILGVLATNLSEGFGLSQRAARTNRRRALRRIDKLRAELARISEFHEDPTKLVAYLVARAFLFQILWLATGTVDAAIGLILNGAYAMSLFAGARIPTEELSAGGIAIASAVYLLSSLTIVSFGTAWYRNWRRAQSFARYQLRVIGQISQLEEVASPTSQ